MIGAAISTGPDTHLDHLVPICALMEIPLFVTEETQVQLCQLFYPSINVQYLSLDQLQINFLTKFDVIFHCGKFWALELKPLMKLLSEKSPCFVFCPHGNSDKEAQLPQVVSQDISLIYGKQMRKLTKGTAIEVGNLRSTYYFSHRHHLDRLAQERIFNHLDASKKTIFYAPTWETKASSSSFFHSAEGLIRDLEEEYNLLIKIHPLLAETHPAHYWYILEKYQHHSSAFFISDFPAIYPLLQKTDIYIGDYSSIGYDFLFFDRPMFFLSMGQSAFLHRCGRPYTLEELKIGGTQKEFSTLRKRIYAHAFGRAIDPDRMRSELLAAFTDLQATQSSSSSSSSSKISAATSSSPAAF